MCIRDRCNSVNFQARTSIFYIEEYLDNTYTMMMIKMKKTMIIKMIMIMMIIAVSQSIFKVGPPNFEWK